MKKFLIILPILFVMPLLALAAQVTVPYFPGIGYELTATSTATNLNKTITVDGIKYPIVNATTTANSFNRAISDCSSLGTSTCNKVIIPAGNYTVTANVVTLKDGISVCGQGENTHITENAFNNFRTVENHIFIGQNINNLTICDMFLSNTVNQPIGSIALDSKSRGIYIPSGANNNITVENIRFEQWQAGLDTNHVTNALFRNLKDFSGTILGNIDNDTGSRDLINSHDLATSTITNINASVVDTAIRLQQVTNVIVSNSLIRGGSIEIGNEGTGPSSHILVEGNKLYRNASIFLLSFSHAATIPLENGLSTGIDDINIIGNSFEMGDGLDLKETTGLFSGCQSKVATDTVSNISVKNNYFYSINAPFHHPPADAIQINYGPSANNPCVAYRWVITGNTFRNINGAAIRGRALQQSVISNDTFSHIAQSQQSGEQSASISILGGTTASSTDTHVFDNIIDSDFVPHACGLYLDDAANIGNIELGTNQITNASTTICYASSNHPILTATTFIGVIKPDSIIATGVTSSSTFAGHVGINTANSSTPYPLTILGGTPAFSLLMANSSNVKMSTTSFPTLDAPMSIAVYFKPTALPPSSEDVLGLSPDNDYGNSVTGLHNFIAFRWDTVKNALYIIRDTDSIAFAGSANGSIVSGAWYQAVYTFDGVTNNLYINGVLASSTAVAHIGTTTPNLFQIGATQGRNFWLGNVDNTRMWNVALSASQIQNMYNNFNNTPRTGLVGEWMYDEGSGTSLQDSSGTGNMGTITNSFGITTFSSDIASEIEATSTISDFTVPGNPTSSLRVYSYGQVDGGFFNATISTSTFLGINLNTGCFAIAGVCLSTPTFPISIANGGTATTTATTNGIPYFNGTYYADNPTLLSFTGTNFGIGTSTPLAKLDIYTSISSSTPLLLEAASGGGCILIKDVAGSGFTQLTTQAGVLTASVHTGLLSSCN